MRQGFRKGFRWLLFFGLCFPGILQAQDVTGQLKVYVINVGQGDAIYVQCPTGEHSMLIDTGDVMAARYPGSPKLFQDEFRRIAGDKTQIDLLVATHPHSDHTGSLYWVLGNYDVKTFLDSGLKSDSATYKKAEDKAGQLSTEGKLKLLHANSTAFNEADLDFCPATNVNSIPLIPGGFGTDENPNNDSVVMKLNYNQRTFLFTGDAEAEEEALLLSDQTTKAMLRAEVLKAGHHASNTSSTENFLKAVNPQMIVISVGEKNAGTNAGYKHPRTETLKRLLTFTKPNGTADLRSIDAFNTASRQWTSLQINRGIYATSVDGTILLLSDGQKTWRDGEESVPPMEEPAVRYVYSKSSPIYHFDGCADAKKIKAENRIVSKTPPAGKDLHRGCPR